MKGLSQCRRAWFPARAKFVLAAMQGRGKCQRKNKKCPLQRLTGTWTRQLHSRYTDKYRGRRGTQGNAIKGASNCRYHSRSQGSLPFRLWGRAQNRRRPASSSQLCCPFLLMGAHRAGIVLAYALTLQEQHVSLVGCSWDSRRPAEVEQEQRRCAAPA